MFYQNGHWSSTRTTKLYTAYAICVISKHPYSNALKDCLSWYGSIRIHYSHICVLSFLKSFSSVHFRSLLVQLRTCRLSEERVKEFAAKLSLVPIPHPGQLHVVSCFMLSSPSIQTARLPEVPAVGCIWTPLTLHGQCIVGVWFLLGPSRLPLSPSYGLNTNDKRNTNYYYYHHLFLLPSCVLILMMCSPRLCPGVQPETPDDHTAFQRG